MASFPRILPSISLLCLFMKRLTFLLLVAAIPALATSHAQMGPSSGGSTTDEAVSSISTIRRNSTPTPAPANAASGPKKPLSAVLATDDKGTNPTTTFSASTPEIFLDWKDDGAIKGQTLRVVWIAEQAVGISSKNKKLTQGEEKLPGPGAFGKFYLPQPKGGFPVGNYRAELYVENKLATSLRFAITK